MPAGSPSASSDAAALRPPQPRPELESKRVDALIRRNFLRTFKARFRKELVPELARFQTLLGKCMDQVVGVVVRKTKRSHKQGWLIIDLDHNSFCVGVTLEQLPQHRDHGRAPALLEKLLKKERHDKTYALGG